MSFERGHVMTNKKIILKRGKCAVPTVWSAYTHAVVGYTCQVREHTLSPTHTYHVLIKPSSARPSSPVQGSIVIEVAALTHSRPGVSGMGDGNAVAVSRRPIRQSCGKGA